MIITYDKADIAVKAFYKLRDSSYPEQKKDNEKEDKNLLVLLLPSISDAYLDPGVKVRLSMHNLLYFTFSLSLFTPSTASVSFRECKKRRLSRFRAD